MKKPLSIITALAITLSLVACGNKNAPHTLDEVQSRLDRHLTVDYTHISTEVVQKDSSEARIVYTFKDENDIHFNVESSYIYWVLERTVQKDSYCTYTHDIVEHYKQDIESALSEHLIGKNDTFTIYDNEQIRIDVTGPDKSRALDRATVATEAALAAVPPFPVKRLSFTYDHPEREQYELHFGEPRISVYYNHEEVDWNYIEFLYEHEEEFVG